MGNFIAEAKLAPLITDLPKGAPLNTLAYVVGLTSVNDGKGGWYEWLPIATDVIDNEYFYSNDPSNAGRWAAVNRPTKQKQGLLFSDDFNRANNSNVGSNYTQTGTSFSIDTNHLQFSSAAGLVFTNKVSYTNLGKFDGEDYEFDFPINVVSTINSTSFGVAFGFESAAVAGQSLAILFAQDSTFGGQIIFYYNKLTGSAFNKVGVAKLPITAGMATTAKVRTFKDKIVVSWTNNAYETVTETFFFKFSKPTAVPLTSSSWYPTFYACGGTGYIDNFTFTSNIITRPDLLIATDSIGKGYASESIEKRDADILTNNYQSNIVVWGNGNCRVQDLSAANIAALRPAQVLIRIGINNLLGGDSAATLMGRYVTFLSDLNTAGATYGDTYTMGVNVKICTLLPYDTSDVRTLNTSIKTTYTTSVIDLYTAIWSGTGFATNHNLMTVDFLHPNPEGYKIISAAIAKAYNLKLKNYSLTVNNNILRDELGRVGFGRNNPDAKGLLDIVGTGSILRISGNPWTITDKGFYFLPGATGVNFGWGLYSTNGSTILAEDTGSCSITTGRDSIEFYANSGLTPGVAFTVASRGRFKTDGLELDVDQKFTTVGKNRSIKTGTNAKAGLVTMVNGVGTVATNLVTANTKIAFTVQETGTLTGLVRVLAKTVGTGFTIGSGLLGDNADIFWELVELT